MGVSGAGHWQFANTYSAPRRAFRGTTKSRCYENRRNTRIHILTYTSGEGLMKSKSHVAALFCTMIVLGCASAAEAAFVFNNFGPGNTFPDSGRILQGELVNN